MHREIYMCILQWHWSIPVHAPAQDRVFRCHIMGMHSAMRQERSRGVLMTAGSRKQAATIIHLTPNTSPLSERKQAGLAGYSPDWFLLCGSDQRLLQNKNTNLLFGFFFHLPSIKSTWLLLCHWALASSELILIWFSPMWTPFYCHHKSHWKLSIRIGVCGFGA